MFRLTMKWAGLAVVLPAHYRTEAEARAAMTYWMVAHRCMLPPFTVEPVPPDEAGTVVWTPEDILRQEG